MSILFPFFMPFFISFYSFIYSFLFVLIWTFYSFFNSTLVFFRHFVHHIHCTSFVLLSCSNFVLFSIFIITLYFKHSVQLKFVFSDLQYFVFRPVSFFSHPFCSSVLPFHLLIFSLDFDIVVLLQSILSFFSSLHLSYPFALPSSFLPVLTSWLFQFWVSSLL